jgi:hypothetical protein
MGSIFAHHVAGGDFVNTQKFLLVAAVTYGVGVVLSKSEMEGPGLAAAIVVTQLFGHMALNASYENAALMYSTHLTFGLLTYFGLRHLESFARWAFDALFARISPFQALPIIKGRVVVWKLQQIVCCVPKEIARFWSPAPPALSF